MSSTSLGEGGEDGGLGRDVGVRVVTDSFLCEVLHSGRKAADAWEDEALGVGDVGGCGDVDDAPTELRDGVADAAHIPSTVVPATSHCERLKTSRE